MNLIREMIISILKAARGEPLSQEIVNKDLRMPSPVLGKLLETLQRDDLIYVRDGIIEVSTLHRIKLAVRALQLGADYERVAGLLGWKEFENLAAAAFEKHGYNVTTDLRFKQGGRRWQIDVIGCRGQLVACVDCKHWRRGLYPSTLRKVVEEHVRRTLALAQSLPNPVIRVACASWEEAKIFPVVLSLTPVRFKFYNGTPIVPVLQLRDFLIQLPMHTDSLNSFKVNSSFRFGP